jgi:hypothetical protein
VRVRFLVLPALILAASAGACADKAAQSTPKAAAGVVDSALPIPELLRRFKASLPDTAPVDSFANAAQSRDALARRFVAALNAHDTADMRRMMLSVREFAWLYYDDHFLSKPPYELPPWLMWLRAEKGSDNGLATAFGEYGGRKLVLDVVACPDSVPRRSGPLELWDHCALRMHTPKGERVDNRFFGTMVGRGGKWKFASYTNDL